MEGHVIIADRPQTRQDTRVGRRYKRIAAQQAAASINGHPRPLYPQGFIHVALELYYALPERAPGDLANTPATWHLWSIPRGDNAANLILTVLTGILYTNPEQAQPLTVTRWLKDSAELEQSFGHKCRRGCAIVRWRCG